MIRNFNYLLLIQILTLLVPFLYYPHVVSALGLDAYGTIVLAQSILFIIAAVINFGYNLYGVKEIAVLSDIERCEFINISIQLKLIKLISCFIPYYFVIKNIDFEPNQIRSLSLLYLTLFVEVFFLQWLFQGLEKNKYAAIINLVSKIILLVSIWVFVDGLNAYENMVYCLVLSSFISSFLGAVFIFRQGVSLKIMPVSSYYNQLIDSYYIFISKIFVIAFTKINGVVIGTNIGFGEVALYDLAEKLYSMMTMPLNTLNQVVYPRVSKNKDYIFVIKAIKLGLLFSFICYACVYFFSEDLIVWFAGENMSYTAIILLILSIQLPINAISFFLGNCFLLNENLKKEFRNSVIYPFTLNAALLLVMSNLELITIEIISMLTVATSLQVLIIRFVYIVRSAKFNEVKIC